MTRPSDEGRCDLCGEPMPEGELMFRFHGYSGPCPKPPLQQSQPEVETLRGLLREARDALAYHQEQTRPIHRTKEMIARITAALAISIDGTMV